MPKIALHTHFTNSWEDLASITIPNTQRYADKHGYEFHVEKYNDGNVDFVKTKTALKLLNEYDLVFCLEADMLITHHGIKIERFVDNEYSFFICRDINGINAGSFIAKNDEFCRLFLGWTNGTSKEFITEQNAWEMRDRMNELYKPIKILPHPTINSIPYKYYHNYGYINYNGQGKPTHEQGNWMPNDFVAHLPGKPMEERISIFNELKQHIVYE